MIDSAGIRALVRGHTTAQRVQGTLRLAGLKPRVRETLDASHLGGVFDIYESADAAKLAAWPWRTIQVAAAGFILCSALVWAGLRWPLQLAGIAEFGQGGITEGAPAAVPTHVFAPFLELVKLIVAGLIGLLLTAIHQPASRERGRSMEQAQILLCVSGAMMMIIIGNSLARAFGIAGAASIIRFKTPVEDPKDVTILFLLMGLGMSSGLGAFAVAGLGTAFLSVTLIALDRFSSQRARTMSVEIQASGREFPTAHVEGVFARNQVVWEPREISQSDDVSVKYHTWLDARTSLEDISAQLMIEGGGVQSVAWEHPKRER